MQLLVNAGFGAALALALLLIGVEHALLWGLLAAALRYAPYVGVWVAAALVLVLSLAMSPGWAQPLLALGLIFALEMFTGNVVEPWVYGRSLGVSEVALLVAAAFWAFLWGPVGREPHVAPGQAASLPGRAPEGENIQSGAIICFTSPPRPVQ